MTKSYFRQDRVSGLRYRANTKACAFRAATPPCRRAAQATRPILRAALVPRAQEAGGREALFASSERSGRKAASNGSWRSLSFVRFLRSRLETIFVVLVSQASAAITGCVQDASYACKNELLTRATSASIRRPSQSTVALQAAKSLPALMVWVSGRDERQSRLGAYRKCKARSRTAPPAGRIAF